VSECVVGIRVHLFASQVDNAIRSLVVGFPITIIVICYLSWPGTAATMRILNAPLWLSL